jgi:hypothetical protein
MFLLQLTERGRHLTAVNKLSMMDWLKPPKPNTREKPRDLHILIAIGRLIEQHEFFAQLDEDAFQVVCANVWMISTSKGDVMMKEVQHS